MRAARAEAQAAPCAASAGPSITRLPHVHFGRACNHPHNTQRWHLPASTNSAHWQRAHGEPSSDLRAAATAPTLAALLKANSHSVPRRAHISLAAKKRVARQRVVEAIRKALRSKAAAQPVKTKAAEHAKAKSAQPTKVKAAPQAKAKAPAATKVKAAPVAKAAAKAQKASAPAKAASMATSKSKASAPSAKAAAPSKAVSTRSGFSAFSPFDSRFPKYFTAVSPFDEAAWKRLVTDASEDFVSYSPFDDRFSKATGALSKAPTKVLAAAPTAPLKRAASGLKQQAAPVQLPPAAMAAPKTAPTAGAFPRFSPMARAETMQVKPAAANKQASPFAAASVKVVSSQSSTAQARAPAPTVSPLSSLMKKAGASPSNAKPAQPLR